MHRPALALIAAVSLVPGPLGSQERSPEPLWHSVTLANGVQVNVLQVAAAPKVAVFTFLPLGLDGDPPGRAQFSHLAEHMLIRSTDPQALRVGQLQLNGETTNQALRLESFAPAERWREAVSRHPRWLSAREFDPQTLEREKVRIAGEERSTVPRGFNHKWATAAWAQLVAGRDHAAVHGDVAAATVDQVKAYVADRVRLARARIFVLGPTPTAEVVSEVRAGFGAAAKGAGSPGEEGAAGAERAGEKVKVVQRKPGHRLATWDLQAGHYLEWYELPAGTTAAEAEVMSEVLTMACFQNPAFAALPGRALAGSVTRGGRRFLLLSSAMPDGAKDHRALAEGFRAAIRQAPRMARMQVRGEVLAARFAQLPDFAAQRRQVRDPRFRDLVEANFAMQCGYASVRLGVPIAEVPGAYRTLDGKRIAGLLQGLTEEGRHSARLSPPE